MATYSVGKFIKSLRKQKGISQEDLCDGICTQKTLSRIETDKQTISKDVFSGLMQRLGINAENYFNEFVVDEEFEFLKTKKQISDLTYEGKYDEAKLCLDKIADNEKFSEGLNRQFYLYHLSAIRLFTDKLSNDEYNGILKDLTTAIKISVPHYKETMVRTYLLTTQEIKILNSIAIIYKRMNRLPDAIKLMYQLKDCIEETKIDFDEKAKTYILILYNLSNYLGQSGKHEDVISICDLAIDSCIKSNKHHLFGYIIFNKAYSLNELGDTTTCKSLLYQAYYILYANKNYKDATKLKEHMEKEHGIVLNI